MKMELFLLLFWNLILIFGSIILKNQMGDFNEKIILILDAFPQNQEKCLLHLASEFKYLYVWYMSHEVIHATGFRMQ